MIDAPRIDAHQHFWRLARGDYVWITPDFAPLHRDHEPSDLRPLLDAAGIDGTIRVQAAATEAETDHMLGLAARHDWILDVIGWTDFDAADAPARITAMAGRAKLVGLRLMIQSIPEDGWMLRDALALAFAAMVERELRFDTLVPPRHLGRLMRLMERHPDLPVVIDHGAKPRIADGRMQPWADDMARLAREPGALCKLSGLVTEAAAGWPADALWPYIHHLLDGFGPDRLMFGSDWPVLNLAGDCAGWARIAREAVAPLGAAAEAAIFGGTARRFYLGGEG